MREIKFRAWDSWNECMVYSSDIDHLSTLTDNIQHEDKLYLKLDGSLSYFGESCEYARIVEKDRWVILQYTGLKDKNGKEIYEGDLLNWKDNALEVRWGAGEFIIWSKLFKKFGLPNGGSTGMINARAYMHDSEVIGNIYKIPEMLK